MTTAELRAAAEKATPGPWVLIPARPYDGDDPALEGAYEACAGIEGADGNPVCVFGDSSGSGTMFENESDHRFIALASERQRGDALAREVERLRGALEPFAGYLDTARYDLDNKGNPLPDDEGMGRVYLTVGDFRRARATLTSEAGHGG